MMSSNSNIEWMKVVRSVTFTDCSFQDHARPVVVVGGNGDGKTYASPKLAAGSLDSLSAMQCRSLAALLVAAADEMDSKAENGEEV